MPFHSTSVQLQAYFIGHGIISFEFHVVHDIFMDFTPMKMLTFHEFEFEFEFEFMENYAPLPSRMYLAYFSRSPI